jgi:hypothetical protein
MRFGKKKQMNSPATALPMYTTSLRTTQFKQANPKSPTVVFHRYESVFSTIMIFINFIKGVILNRTKVTKKDGTPFHWKDLQVGIDVELFGKKYHLTDADPFTREFYHSQGKFTNTAKQLNKQLNF